MFFPICHPERSEGSREHKVSATEIFRRFAPLNDIMIEISFYLLYGGAVVAISLSYLQLPDGLHTMSVGEGEEYPCRQHPFDNESSIESWQKQ